MYGDLKSIAEAAAKGSFHPALPKECDKLAVTKLVTEAMIWHWKEKKWV